MLCVVGIAVAAAVIAGERLESAPAATTAETDVALDPGGDTEAGAEELPALLPMPGELREEGGLLWWSEPTCRAGALELSSGEVRPMPGEPCRVWPAPDGSSSVVLATGSDGERGVVLVRREDAGPIRLDHAHGRPVGAISWAPDSEGLSVCIETRHGAIVQTVAAEGAGSEQGSACLSAWLPDGRLALARLGTPAVEIDGEVAVAQSELLALLPGGEQGVSVTALGSGGPGVAVGVVGTAGGDGEPAAIAAFSENGSLLFSAHLRRGTLPVAIGLAPDGTALWYLSGRTGKGAALLAIPGGRRLLPFDARWFSWSPSGRYLAAAVQDGVEVSTWPGGELVATIPVDAVTLAWTLSP